MTRREFSSFNWLLVEWDVRWHSTNNLNLINMEWKNTSYLALSCASAFNPTNERVQSVTIGNSVKRWPLRHMKWNPYQWLFARGLHISMRPFGAPLQMTFDWIRMIKCSRISIHVRAAIVMTRNMYTDQERLKSCSNRLVNNTSCV